MRYFFISDNVDTATGLRLAGIAGVRAHERAEVQQALASCLNDPDIGIILINERLSAMCPELIYELKLKSSRTLVVEIPDRHGTGRTPDSITKYIREAIGVKV